LRTCPTTMGKITNKRENMDQTEINNQAEAFAALPRAERKAKFADLPREVQKVARSIIEKRRGIAFRTQDGGIVFDRETLRNQVLHFAQKVQNCEQRAAVAKQRVVDLKNQARDIYGDEYLAEVEAALDNLA